MAGTERTCTSASAGGKRCLDVAISMTLLIALAPLMGAVAAAICLSMGRPVLFRQWRPGLHGRSFMLLKFRTMIDRRDADGNSAPDATRLTSLGRLLRSTSLDELPELWNVLKGEMSLVGPRPLLVEYLGLYSPEQARRHEVRPGITGWAQVNGRNSLAWEQKFALDVWYVDHWSMWLDIKILGLSIVRVLSARGVTQTGRATTEKFRGNEQ